MQVAALHATGSGWNLQGGSAESLLAEKKNNARHLISQLVMLQIPAAPFEVEKKPRALDQTRAALLGRNGNKQLLLLGYYYYYYSFQSHLKFHHSVRAERRTRATIQQQLKQEIFSLRKLSAFFFINFPFSSIRTNSLINQTKKKSSSSRIIERFVKSLIRCFSFLHEFKSMSQ